MEFFIDIYKNVYIAYRLNGVSVGLVRIKGERKINLVLLKANANSLK